MVMVTKRDFPGITWYWYVLAYKPSLSAFTVTRYFRFLYEIVGGLLANGLFKHCLHQKHKHKYVHLFCWYSFAISQTTVLLARIRKKNNVNRFTWINSLLDGATLTLYNCTFGRKLTNRIAFRLIAMSAVSSMLITSVKCNSLPEMIIMYMYRQYIQLIYFVSVYIQLVHSYVIVNTLIYLDATMLRYSATEANNNRNKFEFSLLFYNIINTIRNVYFTCSVQKTPLKVSGFSFLSTHIYISVW